mmetsp:Transcript_15006/g.26317  ORF Transcript_15006/g.26317 Transcript_15006/m.26317 type:complete len:566 (+) Transcript_15006:2329-4026(+)
MKHAILCALTLGAGIQASSALEPSELQNELANVRRLLGGDSESERELLKAFVQKLFTRTYQVDGEWDEVERLKAQYDENRTHNNYCNTLDQLVMPYIAAPMALAGFQGIFDKLAPFPELDLKTESGVIDMNKPMTKLDGTPNFVPKAEVNNNNADEGEIVIGIAADWGAGTIEAQGFADHMYEVNPHYTFHLGDIYLSGTPEEVKEKMLETHPCQNGNKHTTDWANGTRGTVALNGNHEMMSRGYGYFETLLPAYGQKTSYGAFQSQYWRFFIFDTAYDSLPEVDSLMSAINYFMAPSGDPKTKLNKAQMDWLTDKELNFFDPANQRGMVPMQHMQMINTFMSSSFGTKKTQTEDQFSEASIGATTKTFQKLLKKGGFSEGYGIASIFGHDHKAVSYSSTINSTNRKELTIHMESQLIGNGGYMSEAPDDPAYYAQRMGVNWLDDEVYEDVVPSNGREKPRLGYNGYMLMRIQERNLTMEYYRSTPHDTAAPRKLMAKRTLRVMPDGTGVRQVDEWLDPAMRTRFEAPPYDFEDKDKDKDNGNSAQSSLAVSTFLLVSLIVSSLY